MADLVTGSDILMHIGLAALAGRSEFRLRRSHRNDKRKYRTAVQNLIFHAFLLSVEISRGCSESTLNEVQSPSVVVALFPAPLLQAALLVCPFGLGFLARWQRSKQPET
jgi:hypothetical protein